MCGNFCICRIWYPYQHEICPTQISSIFLEYYETNKAQSYNLQLELIWNFTGVSFSLSRHIASGKSISTSCTRGSYRPTELTRRKTNKTVMSKILKYIRPPRHFSDLHEPSKTPHQNQKWSSLYLQVLQIFIASQRGNEKMDNNHAWV